MGTLLRACFVMVSLLVSSQGVRAQTGGASAKLSGQVSAAVAVSIHEARSLNDRAQVSAVSLDATTVAVTISGSGIEDAQVDLPLLLRSNVGYNLRASFLSRDVLALRLSVTGMRATGKFVHANALEALRLEDRAAALQGVQADQLIPRNSPLFISLLSGSAVSKAGTLTSPDNAIEVVLSVRIRPESAADSWSTRLTISATPAP